MIGMLRRRLMSNMAKAKNIAVGTVTATVENISSFTRRTLLTVSDLDFMPTNVVVVRKGVSSQYLLCVWGSTGYYGAPNGGVVSETVKRSFNANGFVMEITVNSSNGMFFGDYNYVAWQE